MVNKIFVFKLLQKVFNQEENADRMVLRNIAGLGLAGLLAIGCGRTESNASSAEGTIVADMTRERIETYFSKL